MYQFLNLLMFDLSLINSKIDSNSCFTSQREREEQVRTAVLTWRHSWGCLFGESGGGSIKDFTGTATSPGQEGKGEGTIVSRLTCAPSVCTYSGVELWPGPSCCGLLLPALDLGNTKVV